MKLSPQLVVSSLAVFVLSACSGSADQRRQADNDFDYLTTAPLEEWHSLEGSEPRVYNNYVIPKGDFTGGVGKQVDIRPPQQVLELIPGARIERANGDVTIWLLKQEDADRVWKTAQTLLAERDLSAREQSDSHIETEWTTWVSEDEDTPLSARYELTRFTSNGRHAIKLALIDWRQGSQELPVTFTNKERYSALMANLLTARYDLDIRQEAERKASELIKQIPISMGTDRSGLPIIIARSPYDVLWARLPKILPAMGFKIEERNQSQGTIKAKYFEPDDEFWQEVGVKPIALKSVTYTFLFGDLGNRTSINVTDSTGKPVEQELLKDMVPVLAAMAEKHQ
ncbi:outer membrane protein assembly factor BamC [Vibrio sp. 404]|uniref:Outer membrane protein assembly factor BamC n=1 Tax=Vibrio marinisediminis TaxID=2758441 RepID=A0A7W2ITC0_9VIBR|nr:outer membrane protein assembly factor BamC [Vibrio marinisediminis]MBA5762023.1 outer membrane protein assembly factor BamC [Vibrio marinisediminis]